MHVTWWMPSSFTELKATPPVADEEPARRF
jgi:hypothetical protein